MLKFILTLFFIVVPTDTLGYESPVILNKDSVIKNTVYPTVARENRLETELFLRLHIDEKGNVIKHRYLNTGNPVFKNVADQMVNQMRIKPAKADGVNVKSVIVVPIIFTIRD